MSKHFSEIKGAGGGGGGGGNSSPPYEAPDSLSSTSEARMLYALSEGRIGGLVEGARSVFLDGTRVQNVDGTNNFSRVIVETRAGTPDQSPVSGFDSVQSETSVGVEVRRAAPVVRTVNDPNADRLRVTVGHQGLLQQTDNGDRVNANVRYTIEVRPNGGVYQTVVDHDEYGKTKARFQRSHTFSLPPGGNPWDVRITRLTDDSTTDKVVNPLAWDTYATIIDAKISYKNTALLALGLDAREFSSLPRVEVELYGKDDIRIPSNYDPLTRTYSGAWDGTFKTGYTNNPVWIFNDLVLAKRYGLGQRIPAELMNKWALYRIAKYCDEYVPDGFGGLEPRFTCNIDLRGAAEDAYKVLNRLVSVFRAMLYWAGGVINAVQDAPVDVVSGVFSHANVVDGKFSYAGSPRRERHTVVIVKYRNPDDNYRYAFEPVEHPEMLAKYGPRILEVEAVGCTSRGQAARFGRWILWTEWNETDVVTFTAGFDAAVLTPGAVIMVSDAVRQGGRHGGRLQAGSTASVLQLDSQVEVTASGFTVACVLPDGSVQSRGVLNAPGQASQLMLDTPLSAEPVLNAMWAVKYKLFRVVKVTESDQHLFEVSAVEHSPGKYAEVEGGVYFDPDDVALTPSPVEVVTVSGLQLSKYAVIERGGYVRAMLSASWDRPDTPYALRYAVQWLQPDGSWSDPEIVLGLSAEAEATKQGQYKIRVSTANSLGRWSPYIESNAIAVDGSEVAPDVPGPTSLALVSAWVGLEFIASWQRVDIANGYRVRVELPNGSLVQEAWVAKALEYKFSYDQAKAAGKVSRAYIIKVRAELDNGAASDWVSISVANPIPAVLAGVQAPPGYKAIDVKLEPDTSADVAGYRIWVSTAPNTAVGATTLAYDGPNPRAYLTTGPGGLPLEAGVTYYVRAAAYDVWGSEVNPTSAVATVPVSVAGGIKPGEITDALVAGVSASKIQGQLVDGQIGNVGATKIQGQLQDVQIAGVSAAKVAGQLAAGQLAAIEANKLIGQVQLSQLAGDVQGSLSSAISAANQALTTANQAATATSVTQLSAKIDALSTNLLPVDLWKPGLAGLPAPWVNNWNDNTEQTLVSAAGPYGDVTTILKAVAKWGQADGGWDITIPIDRTKAYRFSVWIKDVSGAAGSIYLGIANVQSGGENVSNAYFQILGKANIEDGRWILMTGYVFPYGTQVPSTTQSKTYDGSTGEIISTGTDFTWSDFAVNTVPRCYQYYSPDGSEQWFAHPRFEVLDGREPSIAELLSGTALTTAKAAITRVATVETQVAGKASASEVQQLSVTVSGSRKSIFVPGDRTVFYPVAVGLAKAFSSLSCRVFRPDVHQDGEWVGSYSADIYAQPHAWGNSSSRLFRVFQRSGAGTYFWGIGKIVPSAYTTGVILYLRGGMTHTLEYTGAPTELLVTMPGPNGALTVYEGLESYAPFPQEDSPLRAYVDKDYRPEGVLSKESVELFPQALNDITAQNTRLTNAEAAISGKASASTVESLQAKVNRRKSYRVVSWGNSYDHRYGAENSGLHSAEGEHISGYARSYVVVRFSADGNVAAVNSFDVYGQSAGNATEMAAHLNAMPLGTLVLIYTCDEPSSNRTNGGLPDAIYRCGGTDALFMNGGGGGFASRAAYVLLGKISGKQGTAFEAYRGDMGNDPAAYISLSFNIENGEFVGISPAASVSAGAILNRVQQVEVTVGGKASAQDVTNLSARVGTAESNITATTQAVATINGKVAGTYNLAIEATLPDGRKKLSGIQAYNDGTISQFVVNADQMLVQSTGAALNPDPGFVDRSAWGLFWGSFQLATVTDGKVGTSVIRSDIKAEIYGARPLPFDPNKTYRVRVWARGVNGANGGIYVGLQLLDGIGNNITGNGSFWYTTIGSLGSEWTELVGTIGANGTLVPPASAKSFKPIALMNYDGTAGYMELQDFRVEEVLPGTLIQNGAITTDKIAANAVNANKIAANSINASHIQAGVITADKLLVGYGDNLVQDPQYFSPSWWNRSFTVENISPAGWAKTERRMVILPGDQVDSVSHSFTIEPGATYRLEALVYGGNAVGALFIDLHIPGVTFHSFGGGEFTPLTSSQDGVVLYADTFTIPLDTYYATANIRIANYCTSGKYVIGLISVTRVSGATLIQDGAIVTDKLAANAVTAGKIAANSVSATHIVGGTITGDKVAANTITGDKIAANTINATHIQAQAITSDKLNVSSLSAITGTIGLLRTAATGARLELESNQMRVYDANNVMRVRLGVW